MKKIFIIFIFLIYAACIHSQNMPDGLYHVVKIDTIETQLSPLSQNEREVFFSELFREYNGEGYTRLIIDTTLYVPLELDKEPETVPDTDAKKKLLLSLSPMSTQILKDFTEKYLNNFAAIIVDGEALTMHKIKAVITGGQLQITRCSDNACERLYIMLKDNEKK